MRASRRLARVGQEHSRLCPQLALLDIAQAWATLADQIEKRSESNDRPVAETPPPRVDHPAQSLWRAVPSPADLIAKPRSCYPGSMPATRRSRSTPMGASS